MAMQMSRLPRNPRIPRLPASRTRNSPSSSARNFMARILGAPERSPRYAAEGREGRPVVPVDALHLGDEVHDTGEALPPPDTRHNTLSTADPGQVVRA
jgi:hypothetical protein